MARWTHLTTLPARRPGKWIVLAAWLLLAVAGVSLAGHLTLDNDEINWLPRNAQSTRAAELAARAFPASRTSRLVVVYVHHGGVTPADRAAARYGRSALSGLADGPVPPVTTSADGEALLISAPIATRRVDGGDAGRLVGRARALVRRGAPAGLTIETTGPVAARADAAAASGALDATFLLVTVGVVALLLLLTYRSPLLPLVPLLCVGLAAVLAEGAVSLLSAHAGMVVSGSSAVLLVVLVFGVGTDYALLLISRYREELARHDDRHDAMGAALRRTLPTVHASAGAVVLALLALLAADMNSTRGLGPVAAAGVIASMLAMTTLLPALLVLLGRGVFWPALPRATAGPRRSGPERSGPEQAGTEHGGTERGGLARGGLARAPWRAVTGAVARRPRPVWTLTAALLAALAAATVALPVGGLSGADNFTRVPESVTGQRLLAAHFPAGTTSPAEVYAPADAAQKVVAVARTTPDVAEVGTATVSRAGNRVRVPVVLAGDPSGSRARHTVQALRRGLRATVPSALIGGDTAENLDQTRAMDRDLTVLPPLILVVVGVVLGALLGSLVAPLVLLGCAVLSFGAALGASALVFHAIGHPRADPAVPLYGFLFLVALGVDYATFLMSRAREETSRLGHRAGVLHALAHTGGVITSAGVVLAATFTVLTITPVVLNVQLGTLVAAGVLIDTLVVRTLLVPALALDIGTRIWWPGRLRPRPRRTNDR